MKQNHSPMPFTPKILALFALLYFVLCVLILHLLGVVYHPLALIAGELLSVANVLIYALIVQSLFGDDEASGFPVAFYLLKLSLLFLVFYGFYHFGGQDAAISCLIGYFIFLPLLIYLGNATK